MGSHLSRGRIDAAREEGFSFVLDFLSTFYKVDADYEPLDSGRNSRRVYASYGGWDFRFIVMGEKFTNEVRPVEAANRGGGGANDFTRHVTGFVICAGGESLP